MNKFKDRQVTVVYYSFIEYRNTIRVCQRLWKYINYKNLYYIGDERDEKSRKDNIVHVMEPGQMWSEI